MNDNSLPPLDLEDTRDQLATYDDYFHRRELDDGAVPASDARKLLAIAEHLVEWVDGTATAEYDDLGAQVRSVQSLLRTVARRVREVQELADEQEKPEAVDTLSDTLLHINDAAAVLADVIIS